MRKTFNTNSTKPTTKIQQTTCSGKRTTNQMMTLMNSNSAGIDIGRRSHFVCVSPDATEDNIREFSCTTPNLLEMVKWLKDCGVTTVAMESTSVYWIPAFRIFEEAGIDVRLVDARKLKNVPGRKTDVKDCQWIRQLHMFGLLESAFVPKQSMQMLRTLVCHRGCLIDEATRYTLRMQKSLEQMNLKLRAVITDIVGKIWTQIIEAIIAGNHDPKQLAQV